MNVRSAVQNQTMAQLGDDDFDEGAQTFGDYSPLIPVSSQKRPIMLKFPRVECILQAW